jgi:hypothetical protein
MAKRKRSDAASSDLTQNTATEAADTVNPLTLRNRITGLITLESSDEILDHQDNWRVHNDAQRAALRGLLQSVGVVGAALGYYSAAAGGKLKLVDGHLRKEEIKVGLPVLLTDLDDDEAALVLATLDPIGAMAQTDTARLNQLLEQTTVRDKALLQMLDNLRQPPQPEPEQGGGSSRTAATGVERAKPQRFPINWEQFQVFHVWCEMRERWPRFNYLISYAYKGKVKWDVKHDGLVMVDSGLITGSKTKGKKFLSQQLDVVRFAEEIQADRVVMMDVPLIPEVLEPLGITAEDGKKITFENAQQFAELQTDLQKVFVIQGPEVEDFAAFSEQMVQFVSPNDVVAIGGGLKNRSGDEAFVLTVLSEVRARFPENPIHLLGVGSPQVLGVTSQFGATSADCATAEMNSNFATLIQYTPTDPAAVKRLAINDTWPVPLALDKVQFYPKLSMSNMYNLEMAIFYAIQQNYQTNQGNTDV